MKVKVRIAPSPTGFLHIGTAQSALYNWLFARKNGGEFHLRIEDTDKERSTKEYEQSILDALEWLGLKLDGEVVRQSGRMDKYRAELEKLLSIGKAFYCHHTKEQLEAERKLQEEGKLPPRHICTHKIAPEGKRPGGIIRLDIEGKIGFTSFPDIIRGDISFATHLLGDFSIAKSLDDPLYNFAVVIDDADMEITHVIRGEDHISNTPKQLLIYEALGKTPPQFAHLPLILAPDRSKLSKRHGAVAVVDYKKDYLPEAIINFLGSMSFTFSKEILTKEEMMGEFELAKVHKSGAVFDIKKLNWINSQYTKNLSAEASRTVTGKSEIPDAAVPLIMQRLEKLSDINDFEYFWKRPQYLKELLIKNYSSQDVKKSLQTTKDALEKFGFDKTKAELRGELDRLSEKVGDKGLVYWPLRVALTGKEKSPDPVDVMSGLLVSNDKTGQIEILQRIEDAIKKLK